MERKKDVMKEWIFFFFYFFEYLRRNKKMIFCDLFLLSIEVSLWQKIREAYHGISPFGKVGFRTLRSTSCCGNEVEENIHTDSMYF